MLKQQTERTLQLRTFQIAAARVFAFARPENWFVSKIPPLLAVAYLSVLRSGGSSTGAVRLIGCGFLSIICVAIYGHVVNDIFDAEADRLAGKVNRIAAIRPVARALLAVALVAAGFLPGVMAGYPVGAFALLALNYLWPTIYSLPVPRLKERGLWGVACDAFGSHVTPTLFVVALVGGAELPVFAAAATVWAAALGLKGILHHQIADRENDIRAGVVTFATRTSMKALQRFLARFNVGIELPVSAVLAVVVWRWCPLATFALVVYTGTELVKYKLGFQFALTADRETIRASVPFANEMYYVLWLPMAAAVQVGYAQPALLWIPVLHALVFYQPIAQQVADWRAIGQNAGPLFRGFRRSM